MSRTRIAIVGAGGFAREVAWLLRDLDAAGQGFDFRGYVVSDLAKLGPHDSRDEVLGDLAWLEAHRGEFDALALGVGHPGARVRLGAELEALVPELRWPALVHPSVKIDRASAEVGHGVLLCAGVVATVNVRFEPYAMLNLACTAGHEARFGRGCVLNPTVNVSGGVEIGAGVLVGTGAQILQYLTVGDGASIGAGAVVTKDVPAGETWVGVPAKPLRRAGT
jgi:sugar O-acyltransferase (sialic acid O-acetyltransferase NeuD family)